MKDGEKKTDYDNELGGRANTNESMETRLYDRAVNGGYQRSGFQEFEFSNNSSDAAASGGGGALKRWATWHRALNQLHVAHTCETGGC